MIKQFISILILSTIFMGQVVYDISLLHSASLYQINNSMEMEHEHENQEKVTDHEKMEVETLQFSSSLVGLSAQYACYQSCLSNLSLDLFTPPPELV